MTFADTHAHLHFPEYEEDLRTVLSRAREAGFSRFLTVGTKLSCSRQAVRTAEAFPDVFAAVGCHPHDSAGFKEEEYDEFKQLTAHPKVCAIGEIGLDWYRNLSPREVQEKVFRTFLRLYRETSVPVIFHVRDAHEDVFRILEEELKPPVRGVLHCFSGDEKVCQRAEHWGLWISFAGNVTYKKNSALRQTVLKIPKDRILLETDCPFLSPEPFRGKRNEPAYLTETARCLARILGMDSGAFGELASKNADSLFGWRKGA